MNRKIEKKATGRPRLKDDEATIRAGFTVPEGLWAEIIEYAEKRELSYSEVVRLALQKLLGRDDVCE